MARRFREASLATIALSAGAVRVMVNGAGEAGGPSPRILGPPGWAMAELAANAMNVNARL